MKKLNLHDGRKKVLFVGFTIAESVLERINRTDRFMPVQTHKFAWAVVNGLESNSVSVDLLSSEPVSNFPANSRLIFNYSQWNRGNSRTGNIMMPFVNLLGLKHLTRFIACLIFSSMWLVRNRKEKDKVILIHGVHSAYLYAVLLTRLVFSIKAVTIVTDPPGVVLPNEGWVTKRLRSIDVGITKIALKAMDGLVTLTKQLAREYSPLVPSIVVEGILDQEDLREDDTYWGKSSEKGDRYFEILYAGGLEERYGLDFLIKGFGLTNNPAFRLSIFGKGTFSAKIEAAAELDKRISFNGFSPPDELKKRIRDATVLINPRPSNQFFTQFSFPSKIIEYMASGRPVISTKLPGIPPDYFPYIFEIADETPEALADLFSNLYSISPRDLDDFGMRGKHFVYSNKSAKAQGKKIADFLTEVLTTD